MYEIEFYEDKNGNSDVWNWIEELRIKSAKSKDARIQFRQVASYIDLLAENGTRLPESITKHLDDDIWELRPGNNRVLYFFQKNKSTYVLLHHFRKKTQKTPQREIKRAKSEQYDHMSREEQ